MKNLCFVFLFLRALRLFERSRLRKIIGISCFIVALWALGRLSPESVAHFMNNTETAFERDFLVGQCSFRDKVQYWRKVWDRQIYYECCAGLIMWLGFGPAATGTQLILSSAILGSSKILYPILPNQMQFEHRILQSNSRWYLSRNADHGCLASFSFESSNIKLIDICLR